MVKSPELTVFRLALSPPTDIASLLLPDIDIASAPELLGGPALATAVPAVAAIPLATEPLASGGTTAGLATGTFAGTGSATEPLGAGGTEATEPLGLGLGVTPLALADLGFVSGATAPAWAGVGVTTLALADLVGRGEHRAHFRFARLGVGPSFRIGVPVGILEQAGVVEVRKLLAAGAGAHERCV